MDHPARRHPPRSGHRDGGAGEQCRGKRKQIDVPYATIDGIDAFAAEYCREHDGERFEIPMLGLFCAAMRRDFLERLGGLDDASRWGCSRMTTSPCA